MTMLKLRRRIPDMHLPTSRLDSSLVQHCRQIHLWWRENARAKRKDSRCEASCEEVVYKTPALDPTRRQPHPWGTTNAEDEKKVPGHAPFHEEVVNSTPVLDAMLKDTLLMVGGWYKTEKKDPRHASFCMEVTHRTCLLNVTSKMTLSMGDGNAKSEKRRILDVHPPIWRSYIGFPSCLIYIKHICAEIKDVMTLTKMFPTSNPERSHCKLVSCQFN